MHFQNSSISQANLKQSIKLLYTAHKVKNKGQKVILIVLNYFIIQWKKSKHCTIRSHFICIVQHWQSCVYTSMFDFHPLFVVLGQWCIHFSQVCFHFNRQKSSQRRYFFGNNDFVWGILSAVWLTELRINFLSKMNFNKLRLVVIPKEAYIPVRGNLGFVICNAARSIYAFKKVFVLVNNHYCYLLDYPN